MKRYFKIEYVAVVGGQVQQEIVEFRNLTAYGVSMREAGFAILRCQEWK